MHHIIGPTERRKPSRARPEVAAEHLRRARAALGTEAVSEARRQPEHRGDTGYEPGADREERVDE